MALPVAAQPSDGRLQTLGSGQWLCGWPGDAWDASFRPDPARQFEVTGNATYSTAAGSGTYLRTGDSVVFTSGPLQSLRFQVEGNRLRQSGTGAGEKPLICHRRAGGDPRRQWAPTG
ncbi:hypothetical protein [Qipengyuania thermophila]|uniref:hypothetical protein n=1 Tax=Qipengyuania thermophila TaxID=2509361 RepID=UPI00101EB2F0|nr:hypothetical protein [Qipengyuania thermophila]